MEQEFLEYMTTKFMDTLKEYNEKDGKEYVSAQIGQFYHGSDNQNLTELIRQWLEKLKEGFNAIRLVEEINKVLNYNFIYVTLHMLSFLIGYPALLLLDTAVVLHNKKTLILSAAVKLYRNSDVRLVIELEY